MARGNRFRNLEGQKFGSLRAKSLANDECPLKYHCECDCGGLSVVAGTNLVSGHIKGCKKCRASKAALRTRKKPFESLYHAIEWRCKRIGRELMSFEDFLTFTNTTTCHYCTDTIVWSKYINHTTNSTGSNLDRMDSSKGYLRDNCVVCCRDCNTMKMKMAYDAFLAKISMIAERIKRGEL